jgi:hypothetical protein
MGRKRRAARKSTGLLKEQIRRSLDARRVEAASAAREVMAEALPYRENAPLFYDTALKVGHVPEPPAVHTQPTTLLPTIRRGGSLLGLNDDEEPSR